MTSTAMEPPGCAYTYVTLYFGIWELEIISLCQASLPFYCRYIDDCFGLWHSHANPEIDANN